MSAFLAFALAFLRAVPAARDFLYKLFELDKARNDAEASQRKAEKDAAVEAVFEAKRQLRPTDSPVALPGLPAHEVEQLGPVDGAAGLSSGMPAGPGMETRRLENDQ